MTTPPPHLPAPAASDPEPPPVRRGGVSRWPLLRTILGAVGLGGAATIGAYWLLGRAVVIDYAEGLTGAQRLTAAFATATAIGAIVALVVNVRKQDLAERTAAQAEAQYAETLFRDREAAFTDRFRAASQQLGAAAPPERIAGVYAMAALGDDYLDRRQQCVDVLCGYLRLPWDPDLDDLAVTSTTVTETSPEGATTAQTTTPARRPHDAQVRATIVAVIAAHTRHPNTRTSWTDLNFNLRGAYFRNIALVECCFSGSVTFDGARFSGKDTWFAGATFSGSVTFDGARFSGSDTSFDGATFSGENTSFAGAAFSGQLTWFDRATFSGENTWFDRATFSAKDTRFDRARFSGSDTSFDGAWFSGENTSFAGATFSGENTSFAGATFSGEYASFDGAGFCGFDASFEDAAFSGTAISFKDTLVSEGILRLTDVVDPRTMLAGLLIEDGAKVLVDGKRYTPPDPPQTQEEGSS